MAILNKGKLKNRILLACDWLSDIAIKKEEKLTTERNPKNLEQLHWKGAIKNEYIVATKEWQFYGPIWHSGQALKSLILASELDFVEDKKKYVNAAKEIATFIINNQIWDEKNPDNGLLLAFEDVLGEVTTSGIFEAIDGLFLLSELTKNDLYKERALGALKFCKDKLYVWGKGVFWDTYDSKTHEKKNPYNFDKLEGFGGRPMQDDSVYFTAWKLTHNKEYKKIFYEICERLILDENPSGNWIKYFPCYPKKGYIHPRHAFWWGRPFLKAYKDCGDKRFLEVAKRAGDWYKKAIRKDGGLFRNTYTDFNTTSFGHATSGTACAVLLWLELKNIIRIKVYDNLIRRCLNYCMKMQFTNPHDKNLLGCILEKVLPPDGTDRNPYFIRDLGTIFFIQAAVQYIKNIK